MEFINTKTNQKIVATQEFIDSLPNSDEYKLVNQVVQTISFEDLQQQKIKELHNFIDIKAAKNLADNYTKVEIDTFPDQKADYIAYTRDNSISIPAIENIAMGRGISTAEMLLKVESAVKYGWQIVGKQQAIETQIKTCETIEELEKIVIEDIT